MRLRERCGTSQDADCGERGSESYNGALQSDEVSRVSCQTGAGCSFFRASHVQTARGAGACTGTLSRTVGGSATSSVDAGQERNIARAKPRGRVEPAGRAEPYGRVEPTGHVEPRGLAAVSLATIDSHGPVEPTGRVEPCGRAEPTGRVEPGRVEPFGRVEPQSRVAERCGPDAENSTGGWSEQLAGGSSDLFAARGICHTSRDDDGHLACVVGMPLLRPEPGVPPARSEQGSICKDAVCP